MATPSAKPTGNSSGGEGTGQGGGGNNQGSSNNQASGNNQGDANKQASGNNQAGAKQGVADQLKQTHREIEAMLDGGGEAKDILEQLVDKWTEHVVIEEEIVFPAIISAAPKEAPETVEVDARRDIVRLLLAELITERDEDLVDALFPVAVAEIKAHFAAEEKLETGLFALAEKHQMDLDALSERIERLQRQFQSDVEEERLDALEPTFFRFLGSRLRHEQESRMPNYRDRDEEGRFRSEDERRGGGYRGNYRDRDERGRFVDEDERGYRSRGSDEGRGYERRGSSRYEDEGRSRDEGQGGWFGDREGHAEAARRGWERREDEGREGRYSRDYDEDRRGSSSRYQDRDEEGRFTSSRDRYRSSRYEDEDDRRRGEGHGGWFGDPEGHSEASRRGWEMREGGGGGRSRSSRDYDEDEDRRGRGRGGWFGDSRGHSEAARRGWEDRR